ncbi:TetR/AcrR family transcriptional regulator [Embleya sp. NBC_00896]|uniref:TetR/AcrR family transcriptional regulator n=1 Tax=Embleya sp. NBC_00896 TaxID=2975961 RepID=UPI002F9098FB|nr:TetR/AcrR family transcriptional regulator [Embleya sp. NBC_00896]
MFIHEVGSRQVQLLDAACRLIARSGVRRLRMEDLAREAGVSVGLPYRYFAGRAELLVGVLSYVASGDARYRRKEALEPDDCGQDSPETALTLALTDEIADEPDAIRLARVWSELYAESLFDDGLRRRLHDVNLAWIDEITGLLADCVRRPAETLRPAGMRLIAAVEGFHSWWVLGMIDADQARESILAAIEDTIARSRETGPGIR